MSQAQRRETKQKKPKQGVARSATGGKFLVGKRSASNAKRLCQIAEISRLQELGYSYPEIYDVVAPRRTLTRRMQKNELLTLEESDRVKRLERIMEHAEHVFGNREKANRWLRKPNRALDNAIPMELLESETGAHLISEELHAIDFGIYA